jgi:hypothetical protein
MRRSRFTAEEFRVLATERPLDVPDLQRRIRGTIEDAERFIGGIPSNAVASSSPSSAEISSGMLERYLGGPCE